MLHTDSLRDLKSCADLMMPPVLLIHLLLLSPTLCVHLVSKAFSYPTWQSGACDSGDFVQSRGRSVLRPGALLLEHDDRVALPECDKRSQASDGRTRRAARGRSARPKLLAASSSGPLRVVCAQPALCGAESLRMFPLSLTSFISHLIYVVHLNQLDQPFAFAT